MIELIKGKSYYCFRYNPGKWTNILLYRNYQGEDDFYVKFKSSIAWSFLNNKLKKLYRHNFAGTYGLG